MKSLVILLSFILLFGCEHQENNSLQTNIGNRLNIHRYGVKTGVITYKTKLKGNVMDTNISGEGIEKLYFDDWGNKALTDELISKTIQINSLKTKEKVQIHKLQKRDNNTLYKVNFKDKLIHKFVDDTSLINHTSKDKLNRIFKQFGGIHQGNEIINGYDCEIWNIGGSKQWLYKGVPLKMEVTIAGITTIKEAISADFNVISTQTNFDLPNYPIE